MNDRCIALDPRLSAIAEMVGTCRCLADIGCDHGRLGAFLLQAGRVQRAQLTDVSAGSLQKARRLIGLLGLGDRVDFRVGDGARALAQVPDVAVIAGMGGALIARLVREGGAHLGGARLVLQPNVAAYELRRTLMECGYRICGERIAPDGRRNYVVIAAERGNAQYDDVELTVGPVLLRDLPQGLGRYAAFRLRVAKVALTGAVRGGDDARMDALNREIAIWEEVMTCLAQRDKSWIC